MLKQDIDSYVGRKLKQRRTIMGLSQESVAKAIGVTFQQVQKYEKGSNAMNAMRLFEFSRFMNVPVAYFFDGVEAEISSNDSGKGKNKVASLSESEKTKFEYNNIASDRESLEVMKSFKRIKEPVIRKRLADLLRAIADNKTILED
ncbi:MAG: helix-turn-helix transcriptional regulator [Rickettsiales bacterium]